MIKGLGILFIFAGISLAQPGVNVSNGPPPVAFQKVFVYSGSSVIGICWSPSFLDSRTRNTPILITAISKAAAASVTSIAHGFDLNSFPQVTIQGATGTGWTGVNGTWVATPTGVDTFTIPVDSQAFGTLAGTVTFTTTAPRKNLAEWAVEKIAYSTGLAVWQGWVGGTTAQNQKCSDAAVSTVVQQ